MWKIDSRLKFLMLQRGLRDEYKVLALRSITTVTVLSLLVGYIPNSHLLTAIVIALLIFIGRWKSIDSILILEDKKENIPLKSFNSYLIWIALETLFLAVVSFYSFSTLPELNQNIILLVLIFNSFFNILSLPFFNIYLISTLPLATLTLFFMFEKGVEFKVLAIFGLAVLLLSSLFIPSKRALLRGFAKSKLDKEHYQHLINKEAQNLKKYIDLLDEVDIATVLVDNKNRITYHSLTLKKWFNVNNSMSFDRFFASIIRDINELNKKEIVSKSGRTYKIASTIIEDIDDNMYYLKVFKDTTKEYKYNKASFRDSFFNPDLDEYDRLTKILKKEPFFKYLEQAIYEADITMTKIAIMIIDINNFNYINETYGEKVGNEILRILSKRLKNSTRDSDLVGRYGDDELIVALKLIEDIETVEVVAKKILKNLIRPFRIVDEKDIFITVSIGISIYPDNTKDIQKLQLQALKALKEAKKKQQNGYLLFRDVALSETS